jgi:hypothetical protein
MRRGSFHVKTLRSRSSALLRAVTRADHRRDPCGDVRFRCLGGIATSCNNTPRAERVAANRTPRCPRPFTRKTSVASICGRARRTFHRRVSTSRAASRSNIISGTSAPMSVSNISACRRIGVTALCAVFAGCMGKGSRPSDSSVANGSVAATDSAASATSATTMIRGTVASVSGTTLAVQTDSGTTNVQLTQPVRVYERQPARMEDITPNTFVGVTTVKEPDGSNRATEIHIFPAELRGLGEGSRPMAAATSGGGTPSTMTNGAAQAPETKSTMTNGNASSRGSTLEGQ